MNRKGFSLIEVLVATALLVMVVGMIGFVFRQSSMSWDSGIHRAEGISQVRAVMGAIERDLRLAVDAREFPGSGIRQQFSSSTLQFVILDDPEASDSDARVPKLVTFSGGSKVNRTAKRLAYQGNGKWKTNPSDNDQDEQGTSTLLDSGDCTVSFETPADYRESDGLPAYIRINATVEVTEKFSGLEVRSLGPNGDKNKIDESTGKEKGDDIVVK